MGEEKPAEYYNEHIGNFLVPYEESIWKGVYDATVSLMPADKSVRIVDVGCGTGRLAEALRRSGYTNYVGFDFASERVAEARRYMPDSDFRVLDMFSEDAIALMASADVISITEVLEHIEQDHRFLRSIPGGKAIVFSVPNFDSPTHVRKFSDMDAIVERFGDILAIEADSAITVERKKSKTFIARARTPGPDRNDKGQGSLFARFFQALVKRTG